MDTETKVSEHDKRLNEGDIRFERLENEMKQNNKTTEENHEMLKEIKDMLCVDTPDRVSFQSMIVTLSTRQNYLWVGFAFIVTCLGGAAFAKLSENEQKPTPASILYYNPDQRKIKQEK